MVTAVAAPHRNNDAKKEICGFGVFLLEEKYVRAYTYMQGRRNHILTYWTGRVERTMFLKCPPASNPTHHRPIPPRSQINVKTSVYCLSIAMVLQIRNTSCCT